MKRVSVFQRVLQAVLWPLAAVAPFAIIELITGSGNPATFPFRLFIVLWFVGLMCVVTITTGFRMLQRETTSPRKALAALIAISSVFFAWFWIMIITDQMPCFLGYPNCD